MQGLTRSQRGATAVLVAILMVVLIGSAAVSVDIGAVWWDRKQLQNGADAGALAIAQACAKGEPSCGTANQTAQDFAKANKLQADASTTGVVQAWGANSVTVRTDTIRQHWFAPLLGIAQSPVEARATATWGVGTPGSTIPLAFSICEYVKQAGALDMSGLEHDEAKEPEIVIEFTKTSKTDCTGPSNNLVSGGFAWIDSGGDCSATIGIDGVVWNDPGKSVSTGCDAADLLAMQNQVILVPLFDESGGTGNNSSYTVFGFAAFRLTGYKFPAISWNCASCGGGAALIKGKFVRYVDLASGLSGSPSGPNLGIMTVALTK